jgi:predicted RND superfamily exporter protein
VYGDDFYATGMPVSTYDISHAFRSDLLKVNLLTLAAIFLIVALSFRSLRMPVLLVFVIEGAIWLTIGFSRLIHEPVFFISYLICVSIQMGATIDYGILLADQYRSRRAENLPPREAMAAALKKSLPTILTSGIILIVAGFAVGRVCTIYYISSIGLLVSRGALISSLLMLVFLPSLLLLFDSFVIRRKAAG